MPPRANPNEKSEDEKLLVAVLRQWDPLPIVDSQKLGDALGLNPRTAASRWFRFKARLFRNDGDKTAGDDMKLEQASAAVNNQDQKLIAGDGLSVAQKRRPGKEIRKRPAVKEESVEEATAAVTNPSHNKVAEDCSNFGQTNEMIDKLPTDKLEKGGRKRAAVKGGSDEPPAQRKKIDKSITTSLNAATSKPGPKREPKTNKDKGEAGVLGEVLKQEGGHYDNSMKWSQFGEFGEQGNALDGLQLSEDGA